MADFTFASLTPTAFLDRSAASFGEKIAVVDGSLRLTYSELSERVGRLVSALANSGVGAGDRVAVLCSNNHMNIELHHGVPLRGGVLVPINIRLVADEMIYIIEHSGASVVFASREYAERARDLGARCGLRVILEGEDYESWLGASEGRATDRQEVDERDLISINYTSGTTGRPKGVMAHHRGAYLGAMAMAYHSEMDTSSTYLWTLPMFHCNGWTFTWAVIAAGGTHLCQRSVNPGDIWQALRTMDVTHFCGAPTVLSMIAEDRGASPLENRVNVFVGGAPPSPSLLARVDKLGFDVTHLYGLTETFGPSVVNVWQPQWSDLAPEEVSRLRARQGICNVAGRPVRVLDLDGADVPADGQSLGEIAVSGNTVMLGYYRDEEATQAVSRSGCFLTGDLGVMHPDGYVEVRDRAKDVIITGGENVASVEVEQIIDSHQAVVESAVVGMPDEKWGEIVVAYVTVREGWDGSRDALQDEITGLVRERSANYKVPRRVIFSDLPKTSTGKIQKNVLRRAAPRNA